MISINEHEEFLRTENNIFILVVTNFTIDDVKNLVEDRAENSFYSRLEGGQPKHGHFANQLIKLVIYDTTSSITYLIDIQKKGIHPLYINVADLFMQMRELRKDEVTYCVKVVSSSDNKIDGTRHYINRAAYDFNQWEPHKMYDVLANNTILYRVTGHVPVGFFAHALMGDFVVVGMSPIINFLNYLTAHDKTDPYIQALNFIHSTRERIQVIKDVRA